MIFYEAEVARLVTDLVIMVLALGLLVYASSRRKSVRSLFPLTGLVFLVAGAVIFTSVYVMEIFDQFEIAALFGWEGAASSARGVPEWLSWTLTRLAYVLALVGLGVGT